MSKRKVVIRGGHVLQADGGALPQDILIEDGRIVAIDSRAFRYRLTPSRYRRTIAC